MPAVFALPRQRADFALAGPRGVIEAWGADQVWTRSMQSGLVDDIVAGLGAATGVDGAAAVAVGALPFDPSAPSRLVLPEHIERRPRRMPRPLSVCPCGRNDWTLNEVPTRGVYERAVAHALELLAPETRGAAGPLCKVVLARMLEVQADAPIDVAGVLDRLARDRSVTTFRADLPTRNGERRTLVGATPELLIERRGRQVFSQPLAGSARRSTDARTDAANAAALLSSEKDLREHAAVVEWIADRLAPHCRRLSVPASPSIVSTETMWHLGTRIEGELRVDTPSLQLLAEVHPTPAVCGFPRAEAECAIRALEPFERGFFAGAVGWCDARGDGAWMLAIRCAEIADRTARLYAGAGIVAGSDPCGEADEVSAKFATMLRAFGIESANLEGVGVP